MFISMWYVYPCGCTALLVIVVVAAVVVVVSTFILRTIILRFD